MSSLHIYLYECLQLFSWARLPEVELLGQKLGVLFKASETYSQISLQKGKMLAHQYHSKSA